MEETEAPVSSTASTPRKTLLAERRRRRVEAVLLQRRAAEEEQRREREAQLQEATKRQDEQAERLHRLQAAELHEQQARLKCFAKSFKAAPLPVEATAEEKALRQQGAVVSREAEPDDVEGIGRSGHRHQAAQVSAAAGFPDDVRNILKSNGVTSTEMGMLHKLLGGATRRDLVNLIASREEARQAAAQAGIKAKLSQENFERAWVACMGQIGLLSSGGAARPAQGLCNGGTEERGRAAQSGRAAQLARSLGLSSSREMIPLIQGVLGSLAERQRQRSSVDAGGVAASAAAAAGAGAGAAAGGAREASVVRWRWTTKALFAPRFAVALQKELLGRYRSQDYQRAAKTLVAEWPLRLREPSNAEKLKEVQCLCLRAVLQEPLPRFGFLASQEGLAEANAAIRQHEARHPEVKQLRIEIQQSIMAQVRL